MSTERAAIPRVPQKPLSVEFIEKKLPEVDDVFKNLNVQYDLALDRFVPIPLPGLTPSARQYLTDSQPHMEAAAKGSSLCSLPGRRIAPTIESMRFWERIFSPARKAFLSRTPVPKKLADKPQYSIRELNTWNEIYERLQCAREKYDGSKFEFLAPMKKGARNLVDKHLQTALQLEKSLPDLDYVSPVKIAAGIVLDAMKTASEARGTILSAQEAEKMTKVLADVETFLAVFPNDENIENASIQLVVTIFQAIEGMIVFFLTSSKHRALSSLAKGDAYQKALLDAILEIKTKSDDLMREAFKSNIWGSSVASSTILENLHQVQMFQTKGQEALEIVVNGQYLTVNQNRQVIQSFVELRDDVHHFNASIFNQLRALLDEHQKLKELVEEQSTLRGRNSDEESNYSARPSRSPTPVLQNPQFFPVLYSVPNMAVPYFVNNPQYYQQWPYPPSTTPLYYVSQPPLQGPTSILSWIERMQITGLDDRDMKFVIEESESIPLRNRCSAKDIINAGEFQRWITNLASTELLVLGNPDDDSRDAALAFSLVSAMITQSGRQRDHRTIALVFFCAEHTDCDQNHVGPRAIITSLICQLLQQLPQKEALIASLPWNQTLESGVEIGDIEALCNVFQSLVIQLPRDHTVICVIDEATSYETNEYETEMETVLGYLLGLVRNPRIASTFKVLVTCSAGTVSLHRLFPDEHCPLSLESLLSLGEDVDMDDL